MSKKEDTVDFIARDGVTIYPSRSVAGHRAGSVVSLPKSHADAIAHLSAKQPELEQAIETFEGAPDQDKV